MASVSWVSLDQLSGAALYDLLRLRQDIFIVEQNATFPDIDGEDAHCLHGITSDEDGKITGTVRLVPPGVAGHAETETSFGRVAVRRDCRGTGLGKELVAAAIDRLKTDYPDLPIRIEGQAYLAGLYQSMGFVAEGEVFDDDWGIPHQWFILP
ncbi:GNAT family N-acetyltransferase [Aestuariispira ectoiniformans]|uniref:GNAT family N-acetyltransferase n=1 Tax=Aestuariispira ectoiniformans TaxID=2775080 RepID=UPI00223BB569|nr:GNAT family N-acetyltransferase [Aestuariispira ectoiniformans]